MFAERIMTQTYSASAVDSGGRGLPADNHIHVGARLLKCTTQVALHAAAPWSLQPGPAGSAFWGAACRSGSRLSRSTHTVILGCCEAFLRHTPASLDYSPSQMTDSEPRSPGLPLPRPEPSACGRGTIVANRSVKLKATRLRGSLVRTGSVRPLSGRQRLNGFVPPAASLQELPRSTTDRSACLLLRLLPGYRPFVA